MQLTPKSIQELPSTESKPFLSPAEQESLDPEGIKDSTLNHNLHIFQVWKLPLQFILAISIACALGFLFGHLHSYQLRPSLTQDGLLLPPGAKIEVWQHNLTFSQAPTSESEDAWLSIIPVGRGFIHHPELAPFISGIAVFHQLHCLHAILVAYHYHAARSDPNEEPHLFGTRIAPSHIRHCFDYLRRAIMCASDTNLEVVDRSNRTTNGWGQEKTCRDYGEIFRFAEKWANSSDTGLVT